MPFVAEHTPGHTSDAPGRDAPGECVEIGRGQRRVAVPDEKEIASPDPAHELAATRDLGPETVAGAEETECRERHGELLCGGGRERHSSRFG